MTVCGGCAATWRGQCVQAEDAPGLAFGTACRCRCLPEIGDGGSAHIPERLPNPLSPFPCLSLQASSPCAAPARPSPWPWCCPPPASSPPRSMTSPASSPTSQACAPWSSTEAPRSSSRCGLGGGRLSGWVGRRLGLVEQRWWSRGGATAAGFVKMELCPWLSSPAALSLLPTPAPPCRACPHLLLTCPALTILSLP